MFEVKVTISAPELAQAINNLAAALIGAKPQQAAPAPQQTAAPAAQPQAPVQPMQNYAPANPTPAAPSAATAPAAPQAGPTYAYPSNPQGATANPMQAPGTVTAQTGAPIAQPTAPAYQSSAPASPYPSNQPAAPQMPQQTAQPTGVPVAPPPQYTIDQIMKGGATLMDAGRVDDLMNLLKSFGVVAVTDLKPEQLGAFATALRGLGAKI